MHRVREKVQLQQGAGEGEVSRGRHPPSQVDQLFRGADIIVVSADSDTTLPMLLYREDTPDILSISSTSSSTS